MCFLLFSSQIQMYDFEIRTHSIEELLRKYRKAIIIKRIQYSVEF
jgi:hypothetical protein